MKLIAEKKSARDKLDALRLVRADGSSTACALPRQGTLPHDLIHYVVESRLPFKSGFLGLVAAGADAEFVLKVVHDKQNPQVETEAVQVESIVEALQTQLWAGAFERDSFIEAAALATAARGKPAFPFDGVDAQAVYDECLRLLDQWNAVPWYGRLELEFRAGGHGAVPQRKTGR